ncbi:MAG: outer membrane protein transport protein [Candidatus Aminicenantes bacterium]|nr:outer membrane protein transport protein [Candidatus Aminicenantes bacterium]
MRIRLLVLLLLLLTPLLAPAQYKPWYNFYNFTYGAKARAMGNAFTAVADDLTAAFWNPAGLAALRGPEFYLSYKTSSQEHEYDLQSLPGPRETRLYTRDFSSRLNQIDFFALSAPAVILGRPCTFALGYYRYIPYGFKGSMSETLTYLYDRFDAKETTMTFSGGEGFDVLAFSAAAALSGRFFLGATLQQFFGSGSMNFHFQDPDAQWQRQYIEKLLGRDVIVGALWTPFPFVRLGLTWHSGLRGKIESARLSWDVDSEGREVNPAQDSCLAAVTIPAQAALGVLLRPLPWLSLVGEYSEVDWHEGTISGYYDAASLPFPQKDSWPTAQGRVRNLRLGAEIVRPLRSWRLYFRGGAARDRQLYADVGGDPVTVSSFSAGLGCEFSPHLLVEFSYQRQRADWLEDGFFALGADPSTHLRASVLYIAMTYRFGYIFKE